MNEINGGADAVWLAARMDFRIEAIQYANLEALFQKPINQMRSNEARSTFLKGSLNPASESND